MMDAVLGVHDGLHGRACNCLQRSPCLSPAVFLVREVRGEYTERFPR
ncbi:rCG21581, partial [Rattus norvegicus]